MKCCGIKLFALLLVTFILHSHMFSFYIGETNKIITEERSPLIAGMKKNIINLFCVVIWIRKRCSR